MEWKTKKIVKYALLPGLRPRIRALFGAGFQFIPYFMALVYRCVRLIPDAHPYLNPSNIGRFGMRHVIAEAANHLVLSYKNIDQIILFFLVLAGLVLAVMQLFLVGMVLFIQPVAAAMPSSFAGFFITPNPQQDLASMMMDLVFGVPGLFNSCIATVASTCKGINGEDLVGIELIGTQSVFGTDSWPYPMHNALHQLFTVYSLGLLVVAVIITLYFMITVVAETAQTGTPFGKRFNKVWAPVRVVVALGLLVPIGYGLNASQYIVLYAAKFGTGFATNGWLLFNEVLGGEYKDEIDKMIAQPEIPEIGSLLQFMFVAKTCEEVDKLVIRDENAKRIEVKPWAVKGGLTPPLNLLSAEYEDFIRFANGDSAVRIRFGKNRADKNKGSNGGGSGGTGSSSGSGSGGSTGSGSANSSSSGASTSSDPKGIKFNGIYAGNVVPTCGDLIFKIADPRLPSEGSGSKSGSGGSEGEPSSEPEPGIVDIQRAYYDFVLSLWKGGSKEWGDFGNFPENYAKNYMPGEDQGRDEMSAQERHDMQKDFEEKLQKVLTEAVKKMQDSGRWNVSKHLKEKGWAAASIWYNRIAEMNGLVSSAVFMVPSPSKYPAVMEEVRIRKMQQDQNVDPVHQYEPKLAGRDTVDSADERMQNPATAMYEAFKIWVDGVETPHTSKSGNVFIDFINLLFGSRGLFDMRANTDVHPLAQLSMVGKGLVDRSLTMVAGSFAVGVGGAIGGLIAQWPVTLAKTAGSFMISISMVALTAGFILYYIVPFLPFIYFFFAFGGWIKGIFEAMVGAPLWALAHLRIDGDGLPGKAAVSGYFLIFEIFLRPILTLFGFIAGITIYAAMVKVLNDIFSIVVYNVSGYDSTADASPDQIAYYRGPIDELFYTLVYAFTVYLIGMSSFKLIDQVPNNILRWMGQSVPTFGDERDDPAQGLVQYAQIGGQQSLRQIGGGLTQVQSAIANFSRS